MDAANRIAAAGLSISHVAQALGVHRVKLSRVVNGVQVDPAVYAAAAQYAAAVLKAEGVVLTEIRATA